MSPVCDNRLEDDCYQLLLSDNIPREIMDHVCDV